MKLSAFVRILGWAAVAVCVVGILGGCSGQKDSPAASSIPTPTPGPIVETVRFSATGDNLIHDGIYKQAKKRAELQGKEGYDFSYCYQNLLPFYEKFDVNWINQETLVTDTLSPSSYPCFSTPGDMGRTLYDVGFRVFNLSNNHTYDKGKQGLVDTLAFWQAMPSDVVTCGLVNIPDGDSEIPLQTVNGITIAYLGYTQYTNGIPTPDGAPAELIYTSETERIQKQIQLARNQADMVVVSVHWGVEGSHQVTTDQQVLAQQLADWGADLIIGTHPHVVQDAQWLTAADGRTAFVAYSLGNFLNAQSSADTMIGSVLTITMEKTTHPSGDIQVKLLNPILVPVINHYDSDYANIRLYLLSDYTQELAKSHGVTANFPGFSLEYIQSVLDESISSEFLQQTLQS